MKHIFAFIIALCLASLVSGADDPVVPDGIHYKRATEEVNEKAKDHIRKLFVGDVADKQVLANFEKRILICGPGLWKEIKSDAGMGKLRDGKVKFEVPVLDAGGKVVRTDEMQGQLFQADDEVLAFWKAFAKDFDFTDLKVRKLTPPELKIFWAMISFDITEPVFVVEGKKRKVLVAFTSPEKMNICWIDDLRNYSLEEKAEGKK